LLSTFTSCLCSAQINLLSTFCRIGQDDDFIRKNLQEATSDGKQLVLAAPSKFQFARTKNRYQGRMVWKNTHNAVDSRHNYHVNIVGEDIAFSSDDFQTQGGHTTPLAALLAHDARSHHVWALAPSRARPPAYVRNHTVDRA